MTIVKCKINGGRLLRWVCVLLCGKWTVGEKVNDLNNKKGGNIAVGKRKGVKRV